MMNNFCRHANKYVFSFLFLYIGVAILSAGCVQENESHGINVKPEHHGKDGFRNPYLAPREKGFFDYYRMRYFGDHDFADYVSNVHKVPVVKPDLALVHKPTQEMQVTWIGHATTLIQYDGISLLLDPVFSSRASPLSFAGPKRHNQPGLSLDDLPAIDFVLISHNHYDHLDRAFVNTLADSVVWLVPLGLKKWFINEGVSQEKVYEFDWWQSRLLDRVTFTATPAQHWSKRSFWDKNQSLWVSWAMNIGGKTIWYSGDTGYNPHQFKEIGSRLNKVDLGIISIGAYSPRWFMKGVHINPEEAVTIHQEIYAKRSIGVQWGTFQLTAEPIDEPPQRLKEAVRQKGLTPDSFIVMKIGETLVLSQ